MATFSGTTGDSYVQVSSEGIAYGMVRVGAVKNVDPLNSLTVRVRQTDCFGGTEQAAESVVLPGATKSFSSFEGQLGIGGPAGAFAFDVKSTVAMLPADYEAVVTQGD